MPKLINKIGNIYGRLTVISLKEKVKGRPLWECRCECGNVIVSTTTKLHSGNTKSCGCLRSDTSRTKIIHGECRRHRTKEYITWANMKQRCTNPKNKHYKNYGGRGIKVCDRWDNYENFIADMGRCPQGHTLEREENNGNYEPLNCKWSNRIDQANNTRKNFYIEYNNETRSLSEWVRLLDLNYSVTYRMLRCNDAKAFLNLCRLHPGKEAQYVKEVKYKSDPNYY